MLRLLLRINRSRGSSCQQLRFQGLGFGDEDLNLRVCGQVQVDP